MTSVQTANSVPEYIDEFIKKNFMKLKEILDEGLKDNNNEGCLYINYMKSKENVDVSFLNRDNIQRVTTLETWNDIKSKYNNNIFIINEADDKRIFIVNI